MFSKANFKILKFNDGSLYLGLIEANLEFLSQNLFVQPIVRDISQKCIIKIGKRNYQLSDQFIITALNDYYKRINETSSEEDRNIMLANYNRLYNSWTILNQAKTTGQYKIMEDAYDEISYQLYLIGYKLSN